MAKTNVSKGWEKEAGDTHFSKQRQQADFATSKQQNRMYLMMQELGSELHAETGALLPKVPQGQNLRVLDLCMAPGGYSASVLKLDPSAVIRGISLPIANGGHKLLLHRPWQLKCQFQDITMLAAECGITSIPETHPEYAEFSMERPYAGESFELVFCDGQTLRMHQRAEYRRFEPTRLLTAQLILALQRIAEGGTLVMLLHKVEGLNTVLLLRQFGQFADLQLFKSKRKHAVRNSFYMVAKDVRPNCEAAIEAVTRWKEEWWQRTFGVLDGDEMAREPLDEDGLRGLLEEFGDRMIELARPIWEIQFEALKAADFMK